MYPKELPTEQEALDAIQYARQTNKHLTNEKYNKKTGYFEKEQMSYYPGSGGTWESQ